LTESKIRVAISGACGRMGKELIRAVAEFSEFQLVSAFEKASHPEIGTDAGISAGLKELKMKIGSDAEAGIKLAELLIEFTFPEPTIEHLRIAVKYGTRMVIGTTGFSEKQMQEIKKASEKIAILVSPNMSLGVNLLFYLARQSAKILGAGYDLEVIEAHHRQKKDAPSGTALKLAEALAEGRGWDLKEVACYHRQGMIGARPDKQIGIQTIRGGDIVGEHTAIFAGEGERIELTHRVSSRATFAKGALRAGRWLMGKPPGLYSMQDYLELV